MVGINPTTLNPPLGAPRAPLSLRDGNLCAVDQDGEVVKAGEPSMLTMLMTAKRSAIAEAANTP
jgi:hypothetical protein